MGACLRLMLGLVYLAQDIQDVHAHEQPCPRYLRLGLIWGLAYLAQDIRTSTPCSQEVPGTPDLPSTSQEADFPESRLSTNVLSTTEYPKTRFTYPPPIHNTYNPSKTTNKPSTEKGENETNKPATGRSREGLAECAERPAIRRPRGVSTGLRRVK